MPCVLQGLLQGPWPLGQTSSGVSSLLRSPGSSTAPHHCLSTLLSTAPSRRASEWDGDLVSPLSTRVLISLVTHMGHPLFTCLVEMEVTEQHPPLSSRQGTGTGHLAVSPPRRPLAVEHCPLSQRPLSMQQAQPGPPLPGPGNPCPASHRGGHTLLEAWCGRDCPRRTFPPGSPLARCPEGRSCRSSSFYFNLRIHLLGRHARRLQGGAPPADTLSSQVRRPQSRVKGAARLGSLGLPLGLPRASSPCASPPRPLSLPVADVPSARAHPSCWIGAH